MSDKSENNQDKKPLTKPKVDVRVSAPKSSNKGEHWKYCAKVAEHIRKEAKEEIKNNEKKGGGEQINAVRKKADEASRKTDPKKAESIKIIVTSGDYADGDGDVVDITRKVTGQDR